MTMPPALIDWALPVTGALGLWLTASSGKWLDALALSAHHRFRNNNKRRLTGHFAFLFIFRYSAGHFTRTLGYALGLAGQPIWLWWTYQQMPEVYGPFVTSVLFTAAWARGLWRNWRA